MILNHFSNIWREAEVCDTKRDLSAMALTCARAGLRNRKSLVRKNNNGNQEAKNI
jgi:hypothetical protein